MKFTLKMSGLDFAKGSKDTSESGKLENLELNIECEASEFTAVVSEVGTMVRDAITASVTRRKIDAENPELWKARNERYVKS